MQVLPTTSHFFYFFLLIQWLKLKKRRSETYDLLTQAGSLYFVLMRYLRHLSSFDLCAASVRPGAAVQPPPVPQVRHEK